MQSNNSPICFESLYIWSRLGLEWSNLCNSWCIITVVAINRLGYRQLKVRSRFEPLYDWLNLEPDLGFSSAKAQNLEPNFGFGPRGSGSNLDSELNFGTTTQD